jgi:hypothetical protein
LRKLRLSSRLDSLRISARAHKLKIQSKISQAMPKSGDEVGKAIEQKISTSQKIWSNVGVAIFSENALENVSHFSSYLLGAIMMILTDIIMIFPTDSKSLALGHIVPNFFVVAIGLLLINAVTYAAMRLIGSKTPFKVFYASVNSALFMSLLCVSIPLALVSFAIFSTMLKSSSALSLFFSIIPFYNYMVYGWSSETIAKLKGLKSIAVALIALLAVLAFNLLLPVFLS